MKKYYIHNGKEEQGPFDIQELKQLGLNANTPIWYIGLDKWILLKDGEQELKDILPNTPPPFNMPMAGANELIQDKSKAKTYNFKIKEYLKNIYLLCTKKPLDFLMLFRVLFLGTFAFLLLAWFISFVFSNKNNTSQKSTDNMDIAMYGNAPKEDMKMQIKENINTYVIPSIDKYSKTNGITTLKVSIANHTGYVLDRVTLKLKYIKSNGSIWNTKEIHFDNIVKDNISSRTFIFKDEGTEVQYQILNIISAELDL